MSTSPPDHRPLAGRVRLPRTMSLGLFSDNPLTRVSDRLQALLLAFAVAVSLIAVPVAVAVGTAVHESRSRVYAEQAEKYRTVIATVVGQGNPRQNIERPTITVPARWVVSGTEHRGDVVAPRTAKVGDTVEVWLNDEGLPVAKPSTTAVDEAVASALALWLGASLSAVAVYVLGRMALDRGRQAAWQRDVDALLGHR